MKKLRFAFDIFRILLIDILYKIIFILINFTLIVLFIISLPYLLFIDEKRIISINIRVLEMIKAQ